MPRLRKEPDMSADKVKLVVTCLMAVAAVPVLWAFAPVSVVAVVLVVLPVVAVLN